MPAPPTLPTIAELVARAIRDTDFIAEIAVPEPHTLTTCAELAAELAAEQWERETGAPICDTVPIELVGRVVTALLARAAELV